MADKSDIEWTESTWNPVTGCTKVSAGCKNCYAERMARRLKAMGQPNYRNGFQVTLQPQALGVPLRWRKPRTIFVNSMSDLFHDQVPEDYVRQVFDAMNDAHWHHYQVLTKRADRLLSLSPTLPWAPHIWQGVSVENTDALWRVEQLRQTGAHIKFLSIEPLLGPLPELNLEGIDWVIVGGESGPRARFMDPQWVRDIRDACLASGVAFFFKQWGGTRKKHTGRELDGAYWNEMPTPVLEKSA
jgi:protein gp37